MHQTQAYLPYGFYQPQQAAAKQQPPVSEDMRRMFQYLEGLYKPETRENSILELAKDRESYHHLGPALWYGVGIMSVLLQEIISVYPLLSTPHLLAKGMANRVSSVLTLLQAVAFHESTRRMFLDSQMCLFLYPFLRGMNEGTEGLRLTSLGVIGALVKTDDHDVVQYLLNTEIFPLCLNIMESGTEFSKTLATFIVQRLLNSEGGLKYVCLTPERFTAVATVLGKLVESKDCSTRLLRYIIRCYLRLSENQRGREALSRCLPQALRNATYKQALESNTGLVRNLLQLLVNIGDAGATKLHESLLAGGKPQGGDASA
ncbi:CAF 40 [Trypanosoma equiperdum]|uniref:Cell differentiation protein, putative n=4 Tax=Trypanozoon TaxID=39700 RepID=Q57UT4_TRYB2|nr:cell differentiation protein, putative [Trypanosoma brucei gambiense DAL972]XP_844191.1 cell differentiation protein, putative [Trypanosoma brucei brucei TREU927]AAX70643.1 cell differentiation protein, putative [Trypanosoma brucei]RHW72832.1 chromatin assembly factor 40 [Trypanosoma brucei equiperdum]SCU67312.1 CAF 40 [Trypanosoma equiperdum]AAZ10632.1 cell differentiation protein, putative [Trypanosoma brucei brucei TREU927]CBH10309.1 cell differentiation protein, putative [Trypanosoma b|eukprot:XP_011772599.1 cell differentiation protein, putative [Trypanosoma brucei gambiense DAL972]